MKHRGALVKSPYFFSKYNFEKKIKMKKHKKGIDHLFYLNQKEGIETKDDKEKH